MTEHDSVRTLKGVGDKSTALFSKCHITTLGDLMEYYPRRYVQFPEPITFAELQKGQTAAVAASVHSRMTVKRTRRYKVCVMKVKDDTAIREIVWFNMPFLANVFQINQKYIFMGEVTERDGVLTFAHPRYYTLQQYASLANTLQPVYALTQGLTNRLVCKCEEQLRPLFLQRREYLSTEYLREQNLISLADATEQIHFPQNTEALIAARRRLVYHEFFRFFHYMDALREQTGQVGNHYLIARGTKVEQLLEQLPYALTGAQEQTVNEIFADLRSDHRMNRLVQGDVGSGKTIVAVLALVAAAQAGFQGALMAPTEVLAGQHYETVRKLVEPLGIRCGFLTGSVKGAERTKCCRQIAEHEVDLIIGTQALIQESVHYAALALVVTDEQHRFGVRQRERLAQKGEHPHVLVMSATPIPRTLAMMLYGDMDISVMRELPANRLPIKNCVVGQNYRPAAVRFMQQQIAQGHQVYVICPMVEESEEIEAENVQDYAQQLSQALPQARIAYLHGQLKEAQKDAVMTAFARGELDILVSTTVIEVGINVPNATFMLIENAERFGLAALHQLRGRVGRGSAQSYCVFMYGKDNKSVKERLHVLEESNDGFAIAQKDLQMRGPGDFFGIRQSGELDFKLADIYQDADCMTLAHTHFEQLRQEGFAFDDWPELAWQPEQALSI